MEFRKEKSEKSKELIREHLKSNIFNIDTGYYKTEKILPITPKPNEIRQKLREFIPKYKELNPFERHFNDLLSDQQKHNPNIKKLRPNYSKKDLELEKMRNRSKKIKDNCYDEKGNFSSKKLYQLDFYGKETIKTIKDNNNKNFKIRNNKSSTNLSIKEKRNNSNSKPRINKRVLSQKKQKKIEVNNNKSDKINFLKNNYNYYYINTDNNKNNIQTLINNLSPNFGKEKPIISRNHCQTIENINNKSNNNFKSVKVYYGHPKGLEKVFNTITKHPIKNNIKKINKKDSVEKDYFYVEIKNSDSNNNNFLIDEKKIKEIFYKNGLHAYDFNDDRMNNLFKNKKMEVKLRKNKNDENFDRNYRKVVKELNKYNINANKCEIIDKNGFLNKSGKKKRKGTPGNALKKNLDENNKNGMNTAFYDKD